MIASQLLLLLWFPVVFSITEFPNPQTEWRLCGRQKASFICDPDFILDRGEAEKLEQLAHEFRRSTSCLCSRCNTGVSIGIFLKHNVSQESIQEYKTGKGLAEMLRKRWNLGMCDDDILILLVLQHNISDFSMGREVQKIFPQDTAMKIINECRFHFDYGWYYQGLESVVNSFNDVLVKLLKNKKKISKGLIIGIALGTGVFLILIIAAIIILYRQVQRRKRFAEDIYDNISDKHREFIHDTKNAHQLEKLTSPNSDDDDDDSNDQIFIKRLSQHSNQNNEETILSLSYLQRKRQLSAVKEENSEENAITEARTKTLQLTDSNQLAAINRNLQVTEL